MLLGIGCHEWAHAYVADRAGDPTPRRQGRLTLDLITHLDPLGTLCMLFAPLGWGRPVEVNPAFFRDPARDHMRVALAGPLTNLVLAAAGLVAVDLVHLTVSRSLAASVVGATVIAMLGWIVVLNLGLAMFNLVPIPPLDGARVARYHLAESGAWIDSLQPVGLLLILVLSSQGAFGPLYDAGFAAVAGVRRLGLAGELVVLAAVLALWVGNAEISRRRR